MVYVTFCVGSCVCVCLSYDISLIKRTIFASVYGNRAATIYSHESHFHSFSNWGGERERERQQLRGIIQSEAGNGGSCDRTDDTYFIYYSRAIHGLYYAISS